jgi:hypothetical protein
MLFLFPIASGPYCATHGPVTPLRAMRYSFLVHLSIVLAGLSSFRIDPDKIIPFVVLAGVLSEILRLRTQPLHNYLSLRC